MLVSRWKKTFIILQAIYLSCIFTKGQVCKHDEASRNPCCSPDKTTAKVRGLRFYMTSNNTDDCVFAQIVLKQWRRMGGLPHESITFDTMSRQAMLMAPVLKDGPMNMIADNVITSELHIDEKKQEIITRGSIAMTWSDDRFNWSIGYGKQQIYIHPKVIWSPKVYAGSQQMSSRTLYVEAKNEGRVTISMSYAVTYQCSFDYTYYPFDDHVCCTNITIFSGVNTIATTKQGSTPFTRLAGRSRLWNDVTYILLNGSKPQYADASYKLCFAFKRASASITTEIVLPLAVTILLSVILPMFCTWKMQVLSKGFCLALQFMCSFVLTLDTEHLQFGSTTPRLLKLHQLVIWTTMISMISTLVWWNLAKRQFELPPPAVVIRASTLVNTFLWWSSCNDREGGGHVDGIEMKDRTPTTDSNVTFADGTASINNIPNGDNLCFRKRRDTWWDVWSAMNRVMNVIFGYVYILGSLTLALPL